MTAEKKSAQMRQEARARLLRAVQQTFEDIFGSAHVAPAHMYRLKASVNKALDQTAQSLNHWPFLEETLSLPTWLRMLHRWEEEEWKHVALLTCREAHAKAFLGLS